MGAINKIKHKAVILFKKDDDMTECFIVALLLWVDIEEREVGDNTIMYSPKLERYVEIDSSDYIDDKIITVCRLTN